MPGWGATTVGWESTSFGWESDEDENVSPPPPPPDATPAGEFTLLLNDLLIGTGTLWQWDSEAPDLFGYDGLRTTDEQIPGGYGETAIGRDLVPGRDLTFKVWTDATDKASGLFLYQAFMAAWAPTDTDQELTVQTPRGSYVIHGRPRRVKPDLADIETGIVTIAVQFRALDPRLYSSEPRSAGSSLSEVSGGLVFPLAFPLNFGSSTPGEAVLVNAGNTPTGLNLFAWADPGSTITSPAFELVESGERIVFTGLTVGEGLTLAVDLRARTATLASTANPDNATDVTNYVDRTVSSWWTHGGDLPAGTNTIRFSSAGGNGRAFYAWRSAWIF